MSRTQIVPAILLVLVAFGFLFFSVRSSTIADQGQSGLTTAPQDNAQQAPDWTLTDVATGRPVRLSDETKRRPVVFSFWATWCGPCHLEQPHLENLSKKYQGRVAFYGVNGDDPPPAIAAYAKQNGLTFPELADTAREAATRYGVDSIPMLVVVDTRDKVRAVEVGFDPDSDLESSLSKLLDSLAPAAAPH